MNTYCMTMLPVKHKSKSDQSANDYVHALLNWYDRHKRELPWRNDYKDLQIKAYRVWLSEIMLQQTVVKAVIPYYLKFLEKWPTVHDLAKAEQEDVMAAWAGLGYYSRARNLHKCAQIVTEQYNGHFPREEKELLKLPGVGTYTSAAIASIAFGGHAIVVDGNIERVMSRFFAVKMPLPKSKPIIKNKASMFYSALPNKSGDIAQALMDLGATICTPKRPLCTSCPLSYTCEAYRIGDQEKYPLKEPKKPKPTRYGKVYVIISEGNILLERRPEKGLLGGMAGLPTSEWSEDKHIKPTTWDIRPAINKGKVTHLFTHFNLILDVYCLDKAAQRETLELKDNFFWHPLRQIKSAGLPTVFSKVLSLINNSST